MAGIEPAAKRYALAAFELAQQGGDLGNWASALDTIAGFMGEADIVANVNWFMSVPVGRDGHMAIAEGQSKPGDYVEVEALADVIAVISNCPQKYNPASGYNPTPVRVETYAKARAGRGR